MATPLLLQQARQRKIIYFGAIVVLFTASLIHREVLLKPQAFALQLRETSRGEVELTSSAVRLMLTGSRGLAVTFLWYTAMDKQKRAEWHELELIVKSITKLQPYFITPWLFQSWNISFNVAVECDMPRDKYYFISRGIELLSEGERRNRGTEDRKTEGGIVFPGNPDLRYYMGFTYQLKLGTSDERLTMKTLLEISCIDPVKRNPDRFWTTDERGRKEVDLRQFALFTQEYPRVVRRLREGLGFPEPARIVKFLEDHQNIANRFKPIEKSVRADAESELKDVNEQFPILPPAEQGWPDPTKYKLTDETIDVFLICRTWYQYAQKPLPPPNPLPGITNPAPKPMTERVPKQMTIQLFRAYPPRAQVYIAETLESEGFFDEDGWIVREWFEPLTSKANSEFADEEGKFVVGTDKKYHSGRAWDAGHAMYKQYGRENGMYFSPADLDDLEKRAALARKEFKLKGFEMPADRQREGATGESLKAQERLSYYHSYRTLTNFETFFYQSEGEKDTITVCMRKALFRAERMRRELSTIQMLKQYEEAWNLFVHAALKYPQFAQVASMQEDLYEVHQRYLREDQELHKELYKQTAVWFAGHAPAILPNWPEAIIQSKVVSKAQLARVIPFGIKQRLGPLDGVRYFDCQSSLEVRDVLHRWTQGAMQPNWVAQISYPWLPYYLLTRFSFDEERFSMDMVEHVRGFRRDDPHMWPPHWQSLITEVTHMIVANRTTAR